MIDASERNGGTTGLTVAWLVLLAAVTAGSTYVVLARHSGGGPEPSPGVTLAIPAPDAGGGGADGRASGSPGQTLALANGPDGSGQTAAATDDEPPASPALRPSQAALANNADPPAWRRYASIYQATKTAPRIAVVLTGLGFSSAATKSAIDDLPPGITLSFTPYTRKLDQWIAQARGKGHEVMLDLPMEPVTYPIDDPGPQALLTRLNELENQQRLSWVIGRAKGYVGLAATMGSRFTSSAAHLKPVLREIRDRGLMFLDNRESESSAVERLATELDLPHAVNDRTLDEGDVGKPVIDARLAQIEREALNEGASIAIGRPYPATLERLQIWVKTLEDKGFELVPITVLAQHGG
jgi:polysaccharide deacetylase 2 family uncharacterized protein YibQ